MSDTIKKHNSKIKTASLGFPRIGAKRELKFALEKFWKGEISQNDLEKTAKEIRKENWKIQQKLDFIPSGDFSYYDHVLDLSFEFNNIPTKFSAIENSLERYFACARGYQKNGLDFHALELSKWFNTNYHYLVPEFHADIKLQYNANKFVKHFLEAKELGIATRPVIIGPVSYLLLGKEKNITRQKVLPQLLKCYEELLLDLKKNGCSDVQIDEPFLVTDLEKEYFDLYQESYKILAKTGINLHLVTYFDELLENLDLAFSLPVKSVHVDISEFKIPKFPKTDKIISLGIVSGRNIWSNDIKKSLDILEEFSNQEIIISSSCSLLHVPFSIEAESDLAIKNRLAFAKEKIAEILQIKKGEVVYQVNENIGKNHDLWDQIAQLKGDFSRKSKFEIRKEKQAVLGLPLFPTTTIGSFPQDLEIRKNRSDFKSAKKTTEEYEDFCRQKIADCIKRQEAMGLDVLVHGEFERNDMVEYFGENLEGFAFSANGWVQSYGSRCVKPPIIHGDVLRPNPITVRWSKYAQSLTKSKVKGMLTGPITILKWSFVRDDIELETVCKQIALALQSEVLDLEKNGIDIIQIDEPAIREGLPLRKSKWNNYLKWAVDCFKISCQKVKDETQIHTHMCYSEFNEIIDHIIRLDADVISIESSRSDLEVLEALKSSGYKNDVGPGVWDIHSPRIPSKEEIRGICDKILEILPAEQIWLNPDCGLKTRGWSEVDASLKNLVAVAKDLRGGK
jgi:5-methyltetrahydropteroyltriglutamate--homocysteine methyltransferase